MLNRLRDHDLLAALAIVALSLIVGLAGCAQLGVQAPQTFNQKAVAAHGTVEGIAKTALTLHQAGKLSESDRTNIVATLRSAEQGIDLATIVSKTDPAGGLTKLDASIAVLTALQAYLATKGAP